MPLQLDIVTPEKEYASVETSLVEVPGSMGDFGVLPGHAPMISSIREGVVTVHQTGDKRQRYLVMGGVSEVTPERCTVLAEYVEDVSDFNISKAESRVADAKKAHSQAVGEEEAREAERHLRASEALLAALSVQ